MKDYDFKPSKVSTQNIWRSVATFSDREQDYPAMKKILKDRGFSLKDVESYNLFPAGTDKGPGVGLPLYLRDKLCGYQRYHPDKDPTYKTYGERGIARTLGYAGHVILCEGMFDCFALHKALRLSSITFSEVAVHCIVGNQLTSEQLHYLLSISHKDSRFYIALDNDRQFEIAKMYRQIAPYRKVKKAVPPIQYGKDWDEAFRDYPKEALDEWEVIFYGS